MQPGPRVPIGPLPTVLKPLAWRGISTLISDAEKDLIKYKEAGLLSPELTEKMKGTIERLKLTLKDLKAQYEEEIKAFSNDGMDKNKKIDDQTYRDQMAAIQGGYY